MKPRPLAVLIGVVLAGTTAGWLWFGRDGDGVPAALSETSDAAAPGHREMSPPPTNADPSSRSPGGVPGATPYPDPLANAPRITSSVVPGMPVTRRKPTPPTAVAPPADVPTRAASTENQPEGLDDLENVQSMFRNFRTRMGENPVGTNAEIMKAVMGGNPARAQLGPPEGQGLNEQGELVDRWGTPYFFHQLSKDQMETRSAGPDRILWTGDDVVIK